MDAAGCRRSIWVWMSELEGDGVGGVVEVGVVSGVLSGPYSAGWGVRELIRVHPSARRG